MSELYNEVIRRQQQDEQQFNLQVASELDIDADRATRIFAVAANTDLPNEVVDADLDNLEASVRRGSFDFNEYTDEKNGAPAFNRFAAENPYHLSVLERDRKNLTRLERTLKPLFQSWDAGWGTSEIAEIIERQKHGDTRPDDAERLKDLRALVGGGHFGVESKFAKMFTGLAKQLPIQAWLITEAADEALLGMSTGVAVGASYGAAGGTIAMPGGGTAVGALGGAATGGMWGLSAGFWAGRTMAAGQLEGNLMLDEAQQLGMDPKKALMASRIHGVIGGLMESFGASALTKRLPGFRQIQRDAAGEVVARVFAKPKVTHALGRLSAQYGEALGTEIMTEIGQEISSMVGMEYLKSQAREGGDARPEVQSMSYEQFTDTLEQTIVETIYGAGLLAGAGPVSRFYRESQQAYQAEKLQHVWKAMGEAAKESGIRETAPTKYEEFVNALSNFNKHKNVLVDAKEFDTYFQEQGIDPDEVATSLGLDAADIAEARDLGASIEIPIAPYLRDIAATEHHEGLMPHLKTEDSISMSEAKLLEKNNPELVKELEKLVSGTEEVDTTVDAQLKIDVQAQLVAAGMDPETAKTSAVAAMGLPNLFRRFGIDPQEGINRFFGGIQKTTSEALEKPTVDVGMDPLLNILRTGKGAPKAKDVRGVTLLDFLKKEGGLLDQGGELSARDLQLEMPGLVSKKGMEMDLAAELAAEAGYIAERDVTLLQEAIDREVSGEDVVGLGADPEAVARAKELDALEALLGVMGLDLDKVSNEEVRKTLDAMETMYQGNKFDTPKTAAMRKFLEKEKDRVVGLSIEPDGVFIYTDSTKWSDDAGSGTFVADSETAAIKLFYEVVQPAVTPQVSKKPAGEPVNVDDIPTSNALKQKQKTRQLWLDLVSKKKNSDTFFQDELIEVETAAIAEILVSEIEETQDFGDVKLTKTFRVQETGKDVKVTQPASTLYRRAVKRRNVVKKLMDCVSG